MESNMYVDNDGIELLRITSDPSEKVNVMEEEEVDIMKEEEDSEGSEVYGTSRIRFTTPMMEIWPIEEVLSDLRRLTDVEDTSAFRSSMKTDDFLKVPEGLLWACWLGKSSIVHRILDSGVSPHVKDDAGRTGMHLAALAGNTDCLLAMLQKGANVNQLDKERLVTPLHCAASSKSLSCVQILLSNGADVNAGLSHGSPLYFAVQSNSPDCVLELLKKGASPDTPQVYAETPLHLAASRGLAKCMDLLIQFGADVHAKLGIERSTALHLAAAEGHTNCVKILLDAKAQINATNTKLQTALHLASMARAIDMLDLLLKKGANARACDADGRTPLHSALGSTSGCVDCVYLLLLARVDVNQPDLFGYTPMHLAALNAFSSCVCLLIDVGGDVTLRTKGGQSVLSFIVRRTPEVLPIYISKFDDAINITDREIGDLDCELNLDFRPLVPTISRQETRLMLAFIEVGQRDFLMHPLCETFLYLKWRRIRKFFIFGLVHYLLFVFLYSFYVIGVYLKYCTELIAVDNYKIFVYIELPLILLNLLLLIKEVFQMLHDFLGYIKQWENWLQCFVIIGVFICFAPGSVQLDMYSWKHHITGVNIFLAWVELMIIVGRLLDFGLYVQMFKTVAVNFFKFLMANFCLLIAFALSFGVLFVNNPSFKFFWMGLLKILIMMSGELEYENIFYKDNEIPMLLPVTSHIFFLLFVILVTVILANLLVGLVVNDIKTLQESASLDRLLMQAGLVARFESMLFSPLLYWLPSRVLAMLHRAALLMTSHHQMDFLIRPNDQKENKIPKYLIAAVYKLVASKKETSQKNVEWSNCSTISPKNSCKTFSFRNNQKCQEKEMPKKIKGPKTSSHFQSKKSEDKIILEKIDDLSVKVDKLQKLVNVKFKLSKKNKNKRSYKRNYTNIRKLLHNSISK